MIKRSRNGTRKSEKRFFFYVSFLFFNGKNLSPTEDKEERKPGVWHGDSTTTKDDPSLVFFYIQPPSTRLSRILPQLWLRPVRPRLKARLLLLEEPTRLWPWL